MEYKPRRVFFEKKSLEYPLGQKLLKNFEEKNINVEILKSNRVTNIPSGTPSEEYREGKGSLVIRVRKKKDFQTCKPSAHYQLPLISGCPGKCEYCYLNTRFGNKPYTTIYVNTDEILEQAQKYIDKRKPEVTLFEAAATSDPIPFEEYTGSLKKAIEYIGEEKYSKLRFVTKFHQVDSLLNLNHKGSTAIRFSINSDYVIDNYEHGTSTLEARLDASRKVAEAGYDVGFIIGPIIIYEGWKEEYLDMITRISHKLGETVKNKVTFEVISHRFTSAAKKKILEVFPKTTLPMAEDERKFKYGQFGYGKYVYNKEDLEDMKNFFRDNIMAKFPNGEILYTI